MTPPELLAILSKGRFSLHSETSTQSDIAEFLTAKEVDFRREVRLSAKDRPDFMVGGIVIEVKGRSATKSHIWPQLLRYAAHENVTAIILATNKSMGLPPECGGKPVYYLSLGKAWL